MTAVASRGGGLRGAVAAEWTKAWTVRSTWWSLLAGAGLMGLGAVQFSIFATNANGNDDPSDDKGVVAVGEIAVAAVDVVQFALIGLAMLLITAEYSGGAIRTALQWVPRRGVLLLAKTAVAAVIGGAAGVLLAVLGSAVATPMLGRWAGFEASGWFGDVLAIGCYLSLMSVFALGLGTLLRSAAGTLIAIFLIVMLVPALLQASDITAVERIADYLPGIAGAAFMRGESEAYEPVLGLLIVAAWAAAAVVAGYAVLRRRDA
ncbi:ABC transporter permease subunit [Actinomadura vinacea]|uniref:ABC transporter permease subunit n=1 Tax=Actinomadura vinacea TaxID=115336 RepID=A0ABN3KIE8_9ACTN